MKKLDIPKEFLIEEYINNRKTGKEVAQTLSCSLATIRRCLKKYNIKKKSIIKNFSKDFLFEKYVIEGKTAREIAGMLNCGKTTALKYLKKYNIKIRPSISEIKRIKHETINGIIGKQCSTCGKWKPLNYFGKLTRNKYDGLSYICKKCILTRNRNPASLKNKKRWVKNNPEKINAKSAKERARRLNALSEAANPKELLFYRAVCDETNKLLGGIYFNVDHIQPFAAGGLHHEDNLQILETKLNCQKKDRWPLTPEQKIRYKGVRF